MQIVSVPCGFLEAFSDPRDGKRMQFYQPSGLYGMVQENRQRGIAPSYPRSPYAAAKLCAYWITVAGERSRVFTAAD
jgi:GDP-D-mannose dehydratase